MALHESSCAVRDIGWGGVGGGRPNLKKMNFLKSCSSHGDIHLWNWCRDFFLTSPSPKLDSLSGGGADCVGPPKSRCIFVEIFRLYKPIWGGGNSSKLA